ncbi:unnamed protein product [Coregonus sp. 'balchen']|nr:unnamed protein product [Coregonus sp. 'balchen']
MKKFVSKVTEQLEDICKKEIVKLSWEAPPSDYFMDAIPQTSYYNTNQLAQRRPSPCWITQQPYFHNMQATFSTMRPTVPPMVYPHRMDAQAAAAATPVHMPQYKYAAGVCNPQQHINTLPQVVKQQPVVHVQDQGPLAAAPPQEQREMLGQRLFPLIQNMQPSLAGKITGMLLEIDNSELLYML